MSTRMENGVGEKCLLLAWPGVPSCQLEKEIVLSGRCSNGRCGVWERLTARDLL